MYKINDIIFHETFGFGIITKIKDDVSTISFEYGVREILTDHNMNKYVDINLVNKIVKSNIGDYFDSWTINKSDGYENMINGLSYENNRIIANIYGQEKYRVTIELFNNDLKFTCSCLVEDVCKHEVALYKKVKNIFIRLLSKTKKQQSNEELVEVISSISSSGLSLEKLDKTFNYILDNLNKDTVIKSFFLIDSNLNNRLNLYSYYSRNLNDFKELIKYLLFNDEIREIINDNINVFSNLYTYRTIVNNIRYGENVKNNHSDYFEIIKYYYFNREYKACISTSLMYRDIFNNILYHCVFESCKKVEYDVELLESFKHSLSLSDNARAYMPLLLKIKFEELYELCKENNNILYYTDLSQFSKEEKIKLLPYVEKDESDIDEIINKLIGDASDEDKILIISSFDKRVLENRQKKKLIEAIKDINNIKYFKKYLESDYYQRNYRYWYDEFFRYRIDEEFDIDENEFFAYFKEEYNVERYEDEIRLNCRLKKLNNEVIINVVVNEKENEYELNENDFDGIRDSIYIRYLISYISNKYKEDIEEKYKEITDEIKKEKDEEKSKYALDHLKYLMNEKVNTYKLIEKKARLEYYFDIDEYERYTLALKVGVDKLYVVKNVYYFFEHFAKQESEEYGKNFTLTHDVENFNQKDKEIIQEILKINLYSDNKKDLVITNNMLDDMFNRLKNKTIYYKKKAYCLRLDEKKLNFKIDKEYRIQLINNLDVDFFLFTDKNIYLINDKEKCIDCIYSTYKDVRILRFLLRNRDAIVKPILKEFKDVVFYDYKDLITIDESIKKDFSIVDVVVKAYFDYEDSIIKCNSEYYIDDKKIEIKNIKEKYNITKINKYNNYLKDLGFENDELDNDGKILNFFSMDFTELKNYCEVYLSESIMNKKISYFTPSRIQIQCQSNIMQAFVEESEYSDEELYKILAAIKKKKKFIIMHDDKIIDLRNDEAREFEQTITELGLDKKKLREAVQLPIGKVLKAIAHQNSCDIDDYLLNMINDISNFKNADIKIPKVNADLRDYQKYGYYWLSTLSKYHIGGILADDMGLGKTLEMIVLIVSDKSQQPNLIVCPKSVVFNWVNEFRKFAPEEKVVEIYGLRKQREEIIGAIKQKEKVTYVVSYDSLRNDIDLYTTTFNYVVLDEAQYIKNINAQKTHNVKKLKAEHRFALTGTPIENNIVDLWSVFDFIIPGYFESIEDFRTRYNSDENYAHVISKRVAPFILRRNKKDVLKDLPDKYEHILSAQMCESQRKVYDAYVMQAKNKIDEGLAAFEILPYLMRLRQICIDPKIFIENYDGESGKMNMLKEIIIDYINNDHRIMIVSQFVKAINEIEVMLRELNLSYFVITGAIDGKKRLDISDKFNNNSEEKIILVSLKAGGTGLNLVGADTVIHIDPWWNSAVSDQATDRTYRIGQKRNVEVIKLICEKSIEQRVIELQNIKKDLIDKVISDNDSSVVNASIDDIKFILD